MSVFLGLDIGGTKCAVSVGCEQNGSFSILRREAIATPMSQTEAMDRLCALAAQLAESENVAGIGISAGGPLDAATGMLQNPLNLPGWKDLSLTQWATERLHAPSSRASAVRSILPLGLSGSASMYSYARGCL